PAPARDGRHTVRPPESERMTGSELHAARSRLGLSRADLARVLSAGENTVRRWEIGKDPVSFRARDTIREIEAVTDGVVNSLTAVLGAMGRPRVLISEKQGAAGEWSAVVAVYGLGWWRAVADRAATAVPGARIGTTEEFASLDAASSA